MLNFLKSLFMPLPAPSSETAKERLRLVLLSDHLSLAPDVVESLKRDLLEVISRYVEIDSDHADVTFEHRERDVAMLASIPITGVRERAREPALTVRVPGGAEAPLETAGEPLAVAADAARNAQAVPAAGDVAANGTRTAGSHQARRRRRKKAAAAAQSAPGGQATPGVAKQSAGLGVPQGLGRPAEA